MKHIILGPTASGKTAYAIALAKQLNGAVISADSRQVYAGMNIGTAKPPEAWKDTPHAVDIPESIEGIPHYLINIASIDTPYSLSNWLADTKKAIAHIESAGQVPIITGGTMLYISALIDGYDIPAIEPNKFLRETLEKKSSEDLYRELIAQDPEAAVFIEHHNTRRIIRALEVMHATGKKFSDIRTKKSSDTDFIITGIFTDYDILREHITARANHMIQDGLAQEIERISSAYPESTLLQTMNYKEQCDIEKMVQSNMRYAHRQMSWWKRRKDISWICV